MIETGKISPAEVNKTPETVDVFSDVCSGFDQICERIGIETRSPEEMDKQRSRVLLEFSNTNDIERCFI